ncbi:trypsin-like peptidase domain-containing protein [Patescibacteria group bacterium]|nr:trypsin-like peptidase domain-containing protein [Patescibacteria group bacterium]MBU1966704.1 trypsin-like peptidase domain-containing protein [Patescibacteria group bacterium]MBU2542961.1 trypsin-like peptidase domain-containing protein [Patescibacteria group bacterium]
MKVSPQTKTFFLGLSVSILILVSFFAGAVADRIFVVKPVDLLSGKFRLPVVQNQLQTRENKENEVSKLGTLIAKQSSIADVAEIASESVVTVSIKRKEQVLESFDPFNFGFGVFNFPRGKVEEVQRDIGTGFAVSNDGLIVTNKHVVSDPNAEYLVIDKDDNEYSVSKIYRDPANDLAIVKVEGFAVSSLPLGDSSKLRVGEEVIAIGTALGEFRHTVTTGVVSGLGRGVQAFAPGIGAGAVEALEGLIQTDAAINPGNSGGPLLDRSGKVIGVNVAVSAGAENIGFALPINIVKDSMKNFQETGSFERPFLGVSYRIITKQAALFNEVPQGAYLVEVVKGSSADQAGLKPEDILTEFGGQSLTDHDLATLINKHKINDRIKVKFWRDSEVKTIEVTLRGIDEK